jgi:eukaryotic-like serine/threonine-protein kinase
VAAADEPPQTGERRPLLEPGQVVGRYRVIKRIGAGAMAEVFLAADEQLGRRAAIKVLGQRHHDNSVIKERFVREARALAQLSHVNLITVFEAGHVGEGQRPYFAMELLEGGDTQQLLDERGPLASGVVARVGAQAAGGLGHAARAGFVHRDVKPANLGISAHGVLKVTDFGLAKSFTAEKSLTGEGFVVGTADYIAPEQARGEELDERADVYALGCTLFHLLTGRPPFRSDGVTQVQRYADVMRAHLLQPIPDPRRLAPDADPALATLLMGLMNKDREQRPTLDQLAAELARIASRLRGELPRVTRRPFTLPTGAPVQAAAVSPKAPEVPPKAPDLIDVEVPTSPLWPRLAGAAVLLLGAAVTIAVLLRH